MESNVNQAELKNILKNQIDMRMKNSQKELENMANKSITKSVKNSTNKSSVVKSKVSKDKNENDDGLELKESSRKWNDNKKEVKEFKRGNFDDKEKELVMNTLFEVMNEMNLTKENLINIVTEKQKKGEKSIWCSISEKLPNRSVQSIHNFVKRVVHPGNYKGEWTQSDIESLHFYVKEKGTKWVEISEILGRTPENCKDKYKEIGGENFLERLKKFDLSSALKLMKYSDQMSEFKLLKNEYLFRENLKEIYLLQDNILLIDTSLKEEKSECIILNILKIILDFEQLEEKIHSGEENNFTQIAKRLKTKSYDDCKNYWDKLMNDFGLSRKCKIRKDIKMIKK